MAPGRKRVLVTGGNGFIGACLVRDLIAAGQDVHLLLRPESNTWRLAGLAGRYVSQWADLRDAQALRDVVRRCRPEIVYHLATYGAYPSQTDRNAILTTNVLGTANLLTALEGTDYQALVNAGSSSEYGAKDGPIREDALPEPRSDYGVARAAVTLLCQAAARQGRPVTTVRIFSAYGPWDDPGRLPSYVMACCHSGRPPRVTAGSQPRDFIHVDDVLALLRRAADWAPLPQARARILHAGTGSQHTVRDMVETILAVCGGGRVTAEFGAEPSRPDEPASWVASIDQTTALTGWQPRYDLRQGVERTWDWFVRQTVASG
jgi:nucleoside-diphosphate-sugar epimerase